MCDNEFRYGNVPRRRSRRRQRIDSSDSDSLIVNVSTRRSNRLVSDSEESSDSYNNITGATSRNFSCVTYNRRKRPKRSILFSDSDSSSSESCSPSSSKKKKFQNISDSSSSSRSSSDSEISRFRTKRREEFIIDMSSSSSSSSSSSDNFWMNTRSSRRTATRVVSDDDTDDDDGIAVANDRSSSDSPIAARNPRVLRLVSSDEERSSASSSSSDELEDDSSNEALENIQPKMPKKNRIVSDNESSSSDYDSEAECCPICFRKLKSQEVGTPESCDHTFCVACLKEWAKNVNTCPVDRQKFSLILVRKAPGGKITEQIPVENVDTQNDAANNEDSTYCEICGENDREDRMMLCDGCDQGYHLECLTPPLHDIPAGEWYCPNCSWARALQEDIEEEPGSIYSEGSLY